MKASRDSEALAARLSSAASTPVPLPVENHRPQAAAPAVLASEPPAPPSAAEEAHAPQSQRAKTSKQKAGTETVGITLRPPKNLLHRYTIAAADRTRKAGRVVSAQEIMLEQLERGP